MLPGGSANTKSIAVADVDGDGDLDVLVAIEGGPCRVLLNAGGGTFPTSIALPYVAGEITRSIAAADLDGDGDLDVLLGNFGRPSRVLLNAGGGAVTATNFTSSLSFLLPGGNAQTNSIMAADVDGDGDLDVLLGNSNSPTLSSGVVLTTSQVVLNVAQLNSTHLSGCQAAACFPRNVALPAPLADTSSIAAADVDGDGDLDVLLGNAGSPSRVLLNAGGGTFPTSITLPGGSAETESIAAADVDGDGDLDVLLGISGTPSRVLFNAGGGQGGGCSNTCEDASNAACDDGGPLSYSSICPYGTDCFDCGPRQPLRFPTSSELPGGAAPTRSIAAADVDGDGDLDVLLGNYGDGIPSRVLINAGDGTFPTSIELTKESLDTNSIAAADLDGDGDIDLLLGNDNSPSRLLLTTGDGTFPTSTVLPGNLSNTFSIVSADIDGDGDLDVLLGNLGSPSRVLLNAGDGTFPTSVTLPGGSANTRSIAVADLDGDGDLDVLLGNENSPSRLLRKTGNSYLSTMLPGNVAVTSSIAAADVDGDGDLDVLLGNADSPSRVLLNAGDGTFPTSITLPGSTNTYSIAAADMDGDGDLDVLLGISGDRSRILLNGNCTATPSNNQPTNSYMPPSPSPLTPFTASCSNFSTNISLNVLGVCENTCGGPLSISDPENFGAENGICNDGGPNSYSLYTAGVGCGLGTDCADCGPRFLTYSIAAADVDGDGDLDVLLGNEGSPNQVLRNDGGGTFVSIELPGGSTKTYSIAAADVDGDGDLDVLLGNKGFSGVMLNSGGGTVTASTFPQQLSIELPGGSAWTRSIAAADVDGDGDLDVLLGNDGSFQGSRSRVVPFTRCSAFGTARSRYGNGCVRCPAPSSRRDDAFDVCSECDEHSQVDGSGECVACTEGSERFLGATRCTRCPAGKRHAAKGTGCIACSPGEYVNFQGLFDPSSCLPCLPGSYSPTFGASTCTPCAPGTFTSDLNSLTCSACPSSAQGGYYCPEGAKAAMPCPAGTHKNASLSVITSVSQCVACPVGTSCSVGSAVPVPCAPGTYNNQPGQRTCVECAAGSFQNLEGQTSCNACSPGYYCAEGAGAELPCPAGTKKHPSLSVMTSVDQCVDCPVGTSCSVGSTVEVPCAPGTFQNQTRQAACLKCPAGFYQDRTGQTSCIPCTAGGYYCTQGAAAALPCPGGTRRNPSLSDVTLMTSPDQCVACPIGTSCSVGSAVAVPCAPGTYNNRSRQETCLKCAAGSFQELAGQTSCSPCTPGYYCAEGAAAALPCPGGTHKNASLSVMTSVDQCVACPVGTSCSVGSAVAVPCAPGTYNNRSRQETCLKCAAGSFQELAGQTSCNPCTPGYYCAEGAAAALPCPGGTHKNASLSVMMSVDQCVACPVGTSCSVGSAVAVPCAPGTYNNRSRQETCLKCAPGSFQMLAGQTSCSPCTPGYYCAEGAATPVPCPGGKFNNRTGLESADGCVPVGFGYWAPTGSVFPIPCPSGFSCPGYFNDVNTSGSQPLILPSGGLTPVVAVETQTVETITGSISLNAPLSSFLNDTALQLQYRQTLAAQLGIPWQDLQLDFSAAPPSAGRRLQIGSTVLTYTIIRTVTTNPTAPRPGTNSSNATTSNVTTSGPPVVAPSFALNNLDPAVLGAALGVSVAALVAPTATVVQQTVTVIRERVCPRGFWCTAGLEVACELGFYNPNTNANSQTACVRCPEFSTTNGTASSHVSQCLCQETFIQQLDAAGNARCVCAPGRELIGGVRCDACKTGAYKDWTGDTRGLKCLECPVPGTTTVQEGADSISQCVCEVGTFASLTRAEMMRATNDSSRVAADSFECKPCEGIHSESGEMTNCTAPGVTLDTIPVMEGHWRQNPRAQYVRKCDLEEACLGGEIAGDTSCVDGHTGPVCDLCVQDPLHFGGRGAPCQLCSDAGDPETTIIAYAIGGAVILIAILVAMAVCKRRATTIAKGVLASVTGKPAEVGDEDEVKGATASPQEMTDPHSTAEAQAIVGRRVLVQGMQQRKDLNGVHAKVIRWNAEASLWDIEMETTGNEKILVCSPNLSIVTDKTPTKLEAAGARVASIMGPLGVKLRILISLCQVVSQRSPYDLPMISL